MEEIFKACFGFSVQVRHLSTNSPFLWNPSAHHHVHRSFICPYPEPHQSSERLPIYARVLPVASFPQISPPKSCMHLSSPPICATCPSHVILYLFTQVISGEEYKSSSSLTLSFLQSTVISFPVGPSIFLGTVLKLPQSMFFLHLEKPCFTPI